MTAHGQPPERRFSRKVDASAGPEACWPWTGGLTTKGYGQFRIDRKVVKAHRYAVCVELKVTPEQLSRANVDIHHECENKLCCNPDHLLMIDSNSHARLHARDISRRVKRSST